MSEVLNLDNTDIMQCKSFESDGIASSPCEAKEYADVLYLPQRQAWYYISQQDAQDLTKTANELDAKVQPLVAKLYDGKNLTEIKDVQQAVLKDLNHVGMLENYKVRSHTYFLTDVEDKKSYVQYLYTKQIVLSYIRFVESASKMPTLEAMDDVSATELTSLSSELGLTVSDITEGSETQKVLKSIQRTICEKNSTRIININKKYLIEYLDSVVNKTLDVKIQYYEKKAEEQAKSEGFSWYKSLSKHNYRFVKNSQTHIEDYYSKYTRLLKDFKQIYQTDDPMFALEGEFQQFQQGQRIGVIAANVFNLFAKLNDNGVVVPEQLLSKSQLFAKDKDTEKDYQQKLKALKQSKSSDKTNTFDALNNQGYSIKERIGSLDNLRFDSTTPKKLSELQTSGKPELSTIKFIEFIESIGFYHCVEFESVYNNAVSNDIKDYIDDILEYQAKSQGYDLGALYILMAVRYQIAYLKHIAEHNLKQSKIAFCMMEQPQYLHKPLFPTPMDKLVWDSEDINLIEYKFAWQESNTHIVEFFLMSEKNKPRYMLSEQLTKIDHAITHGQITQLDLQHKIDVATGTPDSKALKSVGAEGLQNKLTSAISDAYQASKSGSTKTVNLQEKVPQSSVDSFAKYTSLIQYSQTVAGGKDLTYVINAHADFLRFCADKWRFEAKYPSSLQELSKEAGTGEVKLLSLNASGSIDLLAGYISLDNYLPNSNGLPMTLDVIQGDNQQEVNGVLHLGQLRAEVNSHLYGSAGIGFAISAEVSMKSTENGMQVTPVLPSISNLPSLPSVSGSVDLFAGARMGISIASEVKWCKPVKQFSGSQPHGLNDSWIAYLDQAQFKNLMSLKQYAHVDDSQWRPIGRLCRVQELNIGIGVRGTLFFGYANKQYIINVGGGVTFGVGGYIQQTIALYPETLLEFVNALVDLLAQNDFRRLNVFTEHNSNKDTLNGFKVLNTLITMSMVTGLDVAQLALLDMNQTMRKEKQVLVHSHANSIANNINDFYKQSLDNVAQPQQTLKAWFNGMPPEARARLLYAVTSESTILSGALLDKVKKIKAYTRLAFLPQKAAPELSDAEKSKLITGVEEESPRWLAVANLLNYWTNDQIPYSRIDNRQVEETFARFNIEGELMLTAQYGNKIMPYIVWSKLKEFLDRMSLFYFKELDYSKTAIGEQRDVDLIKNVLDKFNGYFNAYPDTRYEEKHIFFENEKTDYIVFNGQYRHITPLPDDLTFPLYQFAYYHLARAQVFPDDYKSTSKDLWLLFTNHKKFKQAQKEKVKQKLLELIKQVKLADEAISKFKQMKKATDALNKGDLNGFLDTLGKQS